MRGRRIDKRKGLLEMNLEMTLVIQLGQHFRSPGRPFRADAPKPNVWASGLKDTTAIRCRSPIRSSEEFAYRDDVPRRNSASAAPISVGLSS